MEHATPTSLPAPLQALPALLLKTGVAIGGLGESQRRLVLALVWAGLPAAPMNEGAVNAALQARLAGAAAFLGTDHVELRRWLVDGGWLVRDDYGREYRRVQATALPSGLRPLADAFAGIATDALAAELRAAEAARRAARRQAWERGAP